MSRLLSLQPDNLERLKKMALWAYAAALTPGV